MLKEFFANRREKAKEREYANGFCWTLTMYFDKHKAIEEIENRIPGSIEPFDQGAKTAIFDLRTMKEGFRPNDLVWVYDRYRFAIPLEAKVVSLSTTNDGVEVQLTTSNNPSYPAGTKIWVSAKQLRFQ